MFISARKQGKAAPAKRVCESEVIDLSHGDWRSLERSSVTELFFEMMVNLPAGPIPPPNTEYIQSPYTQYGDPTPNKDRHGVHTSLLLVTGCTQYFILFI